MQPRGPAPALVSYADAVQRAAPAVVNIYTARLVTERLAACVNRIAGVQSTYVWKGELQNDTEVLLVIKTTTAKLATLEARVKALHPYAVPELIAVPVVGGSKEYLEWVRESVKS